MIYDKMTFNLHLSLVLMNYIVVRLIILNFRFNIFNNYVLLAFSV